MNEMSTICALSTPAGQGAIAVIRLSGPDSFTVLDKIFTTKRRGAGRTQGYTVLFGSVYDNNDPIDQVLVSTFVGPHSYTGEDTVEISCHGSTYIQQKILELLLKNGATLAAPGEFTQRAFLNGKLDLSQAEAVADLIATSSKAAHSMAMNQMRGGFSEQINILRKQLLDFTSLLELELDFGEEDVEFADRTQLRELLTAIKEMIDSLKNSFRLGNAIKNGIPVTIAGDTNVGKSTLLNALLNDDKAIVSDIAGTTRDTIEDVINMEGITFRFIDTAGIRQTDNSIETEGIERTYRKIEQAQIVLFLLDLTQDHETNLNKLSDIRTRITNQFLIILGNKADVTNKAVINKMLSEVSLSENEDMAFISAKNKLNLDHLTGLLLETVSRFHASDNEVIVSNVRHFEALSKASESLERASAGLDHGLASDLVAIDIRQTLHYLADIVGEVTTNEVLGNIFKNFCIGK